MSINGILGEIHKKTAADPNIHTVAMFDEVIPYHYRTGATDFTKLKMFPNITCIIGVSPYGVVKNWNQDISPPEIVCPPNNETFYSRKLPVNQRNCQRVRNFYTFVVDHVHGRRGHISMKNDIIDPNVQKGSLPVWLKYVCPGKPKVREDFYQTWDITQQGKFEELLRLIREAVPSLSGMRSVTVLLPDNQTYHHSFQAPPKWRIAKRKDIVGVEDDAVVLLNVPILPELVSRAISLLVIVGEKESNLYGSQTVFEAHLRGLVNTIRRYPPYDMINL